MAVVANTGRGVVVVVGVVVDVGICIVVLVGVVFGAKNDDDNKVASTAA